MQRHLQPAEEAGFTWWQTETGGILITPLPAATELKPVLVDNEGKVLEGVADGNLCIADSWPGQMRSVTEITSASSKPIFRPTRASILPVTAAGATRTVITGSPVASTTCSTSPATASA